MSLSKDAEADALDSLADESEAVAQDQRRMAADVRRLARERRKGTPWEALAPRLGVARIVELIFAGAQRLRSNASRLRMLASTGLSREGVTTRDIGSLFGVSHQRISSLLGRDDGE